MYTFLTIFMYYIILGYQQTNVKHRGVGKGKLTERLLAEGLLTPQMLRELQYEWIRSTKKKK